MKQLHCDVVILGGGPAGLATALSLRKHNRDLTLVVLERSAYERVRIGETLPPGAQALLEQLEVWPAFTQREYVPAYGSCAVWGSDQPYTNEFIYGMHGRGWHVDRRDFDLLLAGETIERNISLYPRVEVIEHRREDLRWRLTVGSAHQRFEIEADFVVDASGRSASFARAQGARRKVFDRLVGAVMFFDVADAQQSDTYTLVEAGEYGWWYSALLPDARLVVACMSDADLVKTHGLRSSRRWLSSVYQTRFTRERLWGAKPSAAPTIHAAYSHHLDRISGDGWLAVGDAACAFDPLSSQGIFKALRGGIFASYAILDACNKDMDGLEKYAALIEQEFAGYLDTWRAYYKLEQRWPDALFWQRRDALGARVATRPS